MAWRLMVLVVLLQHSPGGEWGGAGACWASRVQVLHQQRLHLLDLRQKHVHMLLGEAPGGGAAGGCAGKAACWYGRCVGGKCGGRGRCRGRKLLGCSGTGCA